MRIYKACLQILKEGSAFNKSAVARVANCDRRLVYLTMDKFLDNGVNCEK